MVHIHEKFQGAAMKANLSPFQSLNKIQPPSLVQNNFHSPPKIFPTYPLPPVLNGRSLSYTEIWSSDTGLWTSNKTYRHQPRPESGKHSTGNACVMPLGVHTFSVHLQIRGMFTIQQQGENTQWSLALGSDRPVDIIVGRGTLTYMGGRTMLVIRS